MAQKPKRQIRKPSDDAEHRNQVWLFQWVSTALPKYPELACLYAVPNGGQRAKAVAAKLKAEGVKAGVHDMHLPVARGGFVGLWVEMKIRPNKLTKSQREWADLMRSAGHEVKTAWGWNEARHIIETYLEYPPTQLGLIEDRK